MEEETKVIAATSLAKEEPSFDWAGRHMPMEVLDRIFVYQSSLAELNQLRLVSKPLQRYAEQRTTEEFIRIHEWVKQTADELKEKIGLSQTNRNRLQDHYKVMEDVEEKMASTLAVYGRLTRDYGCFRFFGRFADECRKGCGEVRAHSLDAEEVRSIKTLTWIHVFSSGVLVLGEIGHIYREQLQGFLEAEKMAGWIDVRKQREGRKEQEQQGGRRKVDIGVNSEYDNDHGDHQSRSVKSVGTQTGD